MTSDRLCLLIVIHAAQIAAVVAAAWLLTTLLKNYSATACRAVWLLVLIKCVTPPVVQHPLSVFTWINGPWMSRSVWEADTETRNPHRPVQQPRLTRNSNRKSESGESDPVESEVYSAAASVSVLHLSESDLRASDSGRTTGVVVRVFAVLSLLSAVCLAARFIRCLRRIRKGRVTLHDERLSTLAEQISRQLKLRRRPRLLVSDVTFGPAVIGVLRPTVVLPKLLVDQLDDETLSPVIAHELVHIKRGDLRLGLIQASAQCLWWFHPLVRLANRTYSRFAEQCCDEQVIASTECTPAQYARSLLAVIEYQSQLRPVPVFPGMKPVEITARRLERIMAMKQGRSKRMWPITAGVLLLAGVFVLPGSAGALVAQDEYQSNDILPQPWVPDHAGSVTPLQNAISPEAPEQSETRAYPVTDLINSLAKYHGCTTVTAGAMLDEQLTEVASVANPIFGSAPKPAHSILVEHADGTCSLKLTAAPDGHAAVADRLNTMRIYGWQQVRLETKIITASRQALQKALTAAGVELESVSPNTEESPLRTLLPSSPTKADGIAEPRVTPIGYSTEVTETVRPVSLAVADTDAAERLLDVLQSDVRSNLMTAPKMLTTNGQSATVFTGVQRPFVVGHRNGQPQIRTFSSGVAMILLPQIGEGGIVLDCTLSVSDIDKVETAELSGSGNSVPVTIQLPHVTERRVRTTVQLNSETVLLLDGGPARNREGREEHLFLFVQAEALDAPRRTSAATDQPPAEAEWEAPQSLTVRSYMVADLIVPIPQAAGVPPHSDAGVPPAAYLPKSSPGHKPASENDAPLEPLVELIRTSVSPESWGDHGGSVMPHAANLSLVIRQTDAVHDEVAELLKAMRDEADHQISVQVESAEVPNSDGSVWKDSIRFRAAGSGAEWALLSQAAADQLRQALAGSDIRTNAAPKVTVFENQQASISLSNPDQSRVTLELNARRSAGSRLIRLECQADVIDSAGQQAFSCGRISRLMGDGTTLVIRYPSASEDSVPLLRDIPHLNELFRRPRAVNSDSSFVLMLTPQGIHQTEEEALTGTESSLAE